MGNQKQVDKDKILAEMKENAKRYKKCDKCGLLHEDGTYYIWSIKLKKDGKTIESTFGTNNCAIRIGEILIDWLKENKQGL